MIRAGNLFFFVMMLGRVLVAQVNDTVARTVLSIPESKFLQCDALGNIYAVSPTNQIYKYNPDGKLLGTLNYLYNGTISSLDASNPLELYIFYKELNTVIFLDNNLAFRGEARLAGFGVAQAAAIARSYDNGIWVFDLGDLQLKKYTKDGRLQQSSGNIRQFIENASSAVSLHDNNEKVVMNDTSNGFLVFDVFATYMKTLSNKAKTTVQLQAKNVLYADSSSLIIQQLDKPYLKNAVLTYPDISLAKWFYVDVERKRVLLYTGKTLFGLPLQEK